MLCKIRIKIFFLYYLKSWTSSTKSKKSVFCSNIFLIDSFLINVIEYRNAAINHMICRISRKHMSVQGANTIYRDIHFFRNSTFCHRYSNKISFSDMINAIILVERFLYQRYYKFSSMENVSCP